MEILVTITRYLLEWQTKRKKNLNGICSLSNSKETCGKNFTYNNLNLKYLKLVIVHKANALLNFWML